MLRVIRGAEFLPTAPRSGVAGDLIFRMSNLIKRGLGKVSYWENTVGPEDLAENIPTVALTGTIALTSGSRTVTGTATLFKTELHLGQFFLVVDTVAHQSFLCVVERIISDTSVTISRAPDATVAGKTGYRLPIIFAVDIQRGTMLRGNVIRYDRGTLFSVGDGVVRLNGAVLGGSSLTATRKPQVSTLNPATGNYTHFPLGLPTPAQPTVTNVAGGTKGMQPAIYGVVVTAERTDTVGYGNPSEPATVTIAAGERVSIDFGAMDGASGQNAWGVWATRYVDAQDTSGKNYLNGPWFRVMAGSGLNGQVIAADLTGTTAITEWLDAEIEVNDLVTFDNDAPPDAEFVGLFNGVPVWLSCVGPGDTSPGPRIFPAKPSNVEAAPSELAYPTSPPEIILGVVSALGRLYLLTTNHLQVTVGTGNDNLPVVIQPYAKGGFRNPYQVDVTNEFVYGCSTAGPFRSIGEGDEQEAARKWAWPITEYTKNWTIGHILVKHDPFTNAMCFFESAHSLNFNGYWTSRVWLWGMEEQEWIADILLTSTTGDMTVSGLATVGDFLEFVCGGRQADDSVLMRTMRFDTGDVASLPATYPAYISQASSVGSNTVALPAGVLPGDLLILLIRETDTHGVDPSNTGWYADIGSQGFNTGDPTFQIRSSFSPAGGGNSQVAWEGGGGFRVADGTEPVSYTFSGNLSEVIDGTVEIALLCFRPSTTLNTFGVSYGGQTGPESDTIVFPTVITTVPTLVIAISFTEDTVPASPIDCTEIYAGTRMNLSVKEVPVIGSTSAASITLSMADSWAGVVLALSALSFSAPVPYFLAPQFSDSGEETRPKRIGPGTWVTGKLTNGKLKVYGSAPGQPVPVADLEAGTNALVTLPLSDDSAVIEGAMKQINVKNLKSHTIRIEGEWNGGERDRIDEGKYENFVEGARR